ncbi:MAG: hypothetical protein ACRYFS_06630 [Janthinobacterium lividum]
MNKITTTLAGLAVLASASMVPVFAQSNNFTSDGPFTFTYSPTTFDITSIAATYNPVVGMSTDGLLSLTGGTSTNGTTFTGATLKFVSTGGTLVETPVNAAVNDFSGVYDISGFVPPTLFAEAYTFNLEPGTVATPAVPEASTVVSFGALLALGGLAVLRRKSAVKNAA